MDILLQCVHFRVSPMRSVSIKYSRVVSSPADNRVFGICRASVLDARYCQRIKLDIGVVGNLVKSDHVDALSTLCKAAQFLPKSYFHRLDLGIFVMTDIQRERDVVDDAVRGLRRVTSYSTDGSESIELMGNLLSSDHEPSKDAHWVHPESHGCSSGVRSSTLELDIEPSESLYPRDRSDGCFGHVQDRALLDMDLKVSFERDVLI